MPSLFCLLSLIVVQLPLCIVGLGFENAGASCSSDEYCPGGWSVLRRPGDYSAHTCNPADPARAKCPKPYMCVAAKCGISFCCGNDKMLDKVKEQRSAERDAKEAEEEDEREEEASRRKTASLAEGAQTERGSANANKRSAAAEPSPWTTSVSKMFSPATFLLIVVVFFFSMFVLRLLSVDSGGDPPLSVPPGAASEFCLSFSSSHPDDDDDYSASMYIIINHFFSLLLHHFAKHPFPPPPFLPASKLWGPHKRPAVVAVEVVVGWDVVVGSRECE